MSNFEENHAICGSDPCDTASPRRNQDIFFLRMPFRVCRNYQECLANTLYAAKQMGLSSLELSLFGSVISREKHFVLKTYDRVPPKLWFALFVEAL